MNTEAITLSERELSLVREYLQQHICPSFEDYDSEDDCYRQKIYVTDIDIDDHIILSFNSITVQYSVSYMEGFGTIPDETKICNISCHDVSGMCAGDEYGYIGITNPDAIYSIF